MASQRGQPLVVKDIDQIAGANGGHAIALEAVLAEGDKQWVLLRVEDIPRLFAKFMSAAHHARDERKKAGEDVLRETWRLFETLRATSVTVSAVERSDHQKRVVVIVDGAADLRIPFDLSPQGARQLAANLLQMAEAAQRGDHTPKPPKPSSRN